MTGEPIEPGQMPSCPLCGRNDAVTAAGHPDGRWFCSCGTLFDGTDHEWRRWAPQRRERVERMAGKHKPIVPQPKSVAIVRDDERSTDRSAEGEP